MNRRHIHLLAALAAVAVLVLCLGWGEASAASSSEIKTQIQDLQSQKQEILAQIEDLKNKSQENADSLAELVAQKNGVDREISLLHAQIANINQQIKAYGQLIADKQDELDEAAIRAEAVREENKERIRAMEEDGKLSYWAVLFKANSFADLLDRLNMVEEIAASDQRRLQAMSEAYAAVEAARDTLAQEKEALEATREELDAVQEQLNQRRGEADELLQTLLAQGEEFQQMLLDSEDLQTELMLQIAQKEKDYKNAQYQEWLATYVPPTTAAPTTRPTQPKPTTQPTEAETTQPATQPKETEPKATEPKATEPETTEPEETVPETTAPSIYWQCPVSSYVLSSPFGNRFHPMLGYERPHEGIDMSCPAMTPIYATRSGVVTTAAYQENGAGNYVSINHGDGYSSVYMHMESYIVGVGQIVTQGQIIGYVGSTGLSQAPHLHFGIAKGGVYVNPLAYI